MYININTHQYWLEEAGQGEPVLLLHGFTGSSKTWSEILPFLEADFRVFRLDLPGHGQTAVPDQVDMETFCRELSGLLDRLSIDQVHLIGYSLGGRTALSFANYFPHRVRSLILESASPGLKTEADRQQRRQADVELAEKIRLNGVETFVDAWENLPLFSNQKNLPEEKQKVIRQERLSQQPEGLMNSLKGMGTGVQPSWWSDLSSMSFPVLLLAGAEDSKFAAINREMNNELPDSRLEIISGAGHAIHVERPEIFGTIVNGFLRERIENQQSEG